MVSVPVFEASKLKLGNCREIEYGTSETSFKEFFRILSKSVSVRHTDLLFGEPKKTPDRAPAERRPAQMNPEERHPDKKDNYIKNNRAERPVRREPVFIPSVMAPTDLPIDNAELPKLNKTPAANVVQGSGTLRTEGISMTDEEKEAKRLKAEAQSKGGESELSFKQRYQLEADELSTVSRESNTQKASWAAASTVTKSNTTDDSYLESLLAGLDDWDNV